MPTFTVRIGERIASLESVPWAMAESAVIGSVIGKMEPYGSPTDYGTFLAWKCQCGRLLVAVFSDDGFSDSFNIDVYIGFPPVRRKMF